MMRIAATLLALDEPFASGFYEMPNAPPVRRWSRAVRRELEHRVLPDYNGGLLYPSGLSILRAASERNRILTPNLVSTWRFDNEAWEMKKTHASKYEHEVLDQFRIDFHTLKDDLKTISGEHVVGGAGYIHCVPNYTRALKEGFSGYRTRIAVELERAVSSGDTDKADFESGLLDALGGLLVWHGNILSALEEWEAASSQEAGRRDTLLRAYRRIPWGPASTFVEAMVFYNFVFHLDYCDNPGRIDQVLNPYYEKDLRGGMIDQAAVRCYLAVFTKTCCLNDSWSAAIGGTDPKGEPAYNDITKICLDTVKGHHRPNYQLRIRPDMPDTMWDAALDAIASGCGQPALYNEEGYYASLKAAEPSLSIEDLSWWNGGGCTETMIQGMSNVGSLDSGVNLLLILEESLKNCLSEAVNFEQLVAHFKREAVHVVDGVTERLNIMFAARAELNPHPIRSLLVDDCIEKGVDFQAGGARYNWSVNNVAGLSNVVDSLMAVKTVVFERREMSGERLLDILGRNFEGADAIRQRLMACPRFGNDNPVVDELAADLCTVIFQAYRRKKTVRGGKFLPSCIMFTSYGGAGRSVGATPDGRMSGDPVADSIGPAFGRDGNGPTAMLKSITRLPLHLATGTPVVNIRTKKTLLVSVSGRRRFTELVKAYFAMGGLQIQVNVVDQETLKAAIAHPEDFENLIIRIGGFSAHFNTLSGELKKSVLERTEHAV